AAMLSAVVTPNRYRQFVLPRDYYVLILAVLTIYFVYQVSLSLLAGARAWYREVMTSQTGTLSHASPVTSLACATVIGIQLIDFFARRFWWWAAPMIVILTLSVGIAILEQTSQLSVTPFMYTVF